MPILFKWIKSDTDNDSEDAISPAVQKFQECSLKENKGTETASEGEEGVLYSSSLQMFSRKTQT